MWQVVRENPRAVIYAVLMHAGLLLLLVFSLDWTPKSVKPGTTRPIQAELVDMSKQREIEAQEKAAKEKAAKEKAAREQAVKDKAAKDKAAKEQAVKEKAAKDKAAKEQAAKEQVAKEKAAKEKAAAERKQKAEQEAKRKAEAKAEAARQREAEQALQAQLAEEQAQHALSQYIPHIQAKIQRNWLRPPGSSAGLSCLILVKLIPGGEVVDAKVVRSSGDPLFDRSVETAVLKASPLPLPQDTAMFKHFREIQFIFIPNE